MKTFKRTLPNVDTSLANTTKYFNQLEFNGIIEDSNIFEVDQKSFVDAQNVYVDDEQFVSRKPLQKDISIPKDPAIYFGYELVDYQQIGDMRLFVRKSPDNKYVILLYDTNNKYYELDGISKYNISVIEHYIICFNDLGAQIFDTTNPKWQDLATSDLVEIPVIKRVIGSQVTEYNKNDFTESYKEEYIWSNQSKPTLPEGTADVTVKTTYNSQNYILEDANLLTEYRLLKSLNISVNHNDDLITIAKGIICIARTEYFLVSFNNGANFSTIYYPAYTGTFLNIASISDDGQYFFFVASDGVYKCYLGDFTWSDKILVDNLGKKEDIKYTGWKNTCHFVSGNPDTFCFITYEPNNDLTKNNSLRIYWKGEGLYLGNDYTKGLISADGKYPALGYTDLTEKNLELIDQIAGKFITMYTAFSPEFTNLAINKTDDAQQVCVIGLISNLKTDSAASGTDIDGKIPNYITYIRGGNTFAQRAITERGDTDWEEKCKTMYMFTSKISKQITNLSNQQYIRLVKGNLTELSFTGERLLPLSSVFQVIVTTDIYSNGTYMTYNGNIYTGIIYHVGSDGPYMDVYYGLLVLDKTIEFVESLAPPIPIYGAYIEIHSKSIISNINGKWEKYKLQVKNNISQVLIDENSFYIISTNGKIYTNYLSDNDSAILTYMYLKEDKYTKVPNITYSDTNLYLSFNNNLQITENSKSVDKNGITKIQLNLPSKNNQSFIDNINAMTNISTTEVALFFKDKITICAKVEDSNISTGYRYDYFNTKLSLGVRLNDVVMNVLEGSYTVYPTVRGLAAMNYQAFMATSDQVVEYLSDNIKSVWDAFYKNSNNIKIIQHRNYLIITNGTRDVLLYHIVNKTWWKWYLPFNTLITISNQIYLKTITRGELCIFTDEYVVNNEVKRLKYYDFSANGENITIDWFVQSQPLHLNAINYYKNMKQLIFQLVKDTEENENNSILAQIKLYRKHITLRDPDIVSFNIEKLRTFVKRFNYWKINEIQWGLANDKDTSYPAKFRLNGISLKYELGDEVR